MSRTHPPDGRPPTLDTTTVDEALSAAPNLLPLRKLASSSVINAALLLTQSVVFLVFTRVALATLGTELYGLWTVLFAVQTVSVVATFGLPQAATKFAAQFGTVARDRARLGETVGTTYVLLGAAGCLATLALLGGRHLVANTLVPPANRNTFAAGLAFVAAGFVPSFIHQGSRALLLARFRNGLVGVLDLAQSAILAAGVVFLASRGVTERGLGFWIFLVAVATSVVSLACVYSELRRIARPALSRTAGRDSLHYGFFAWVAVLGSMLFDGGDRLLVSHLLGPGLAGAYGIATGVAMRLTQLNTPATMLLSPFVSSHEASDRLDTVARALRLTNRAVACLLSAAGILLLVWATEILSLWISPEFAAQYAPMFSVLVLVYATFSMAGPGYQTLLGLGRVRFLALLGAIGSIGTLTAIAILAPRYGVLGAAFANGAYLTVILASFRALTATGLPSGRTFLKDVGTPLGLLYLAGWISIAHVGVLERAGLSAIAMIILAVHGWRGLVSGQTSPRQ